MRLDDRAARRVGHEIPLVERGKRLVQRVASLHSRETVLVVCVQPLVME